MSKLVNTSSNREVTRTSMNPDLWKTLQQELLDKILFFLPAPALCKFRCVQKRWDKLVSSPEFGAGWLKTARHEAVLVARYTLPVGRHIGVPNRPEGEEHGWSILDGSTLEGSARQWYTKKKEGQDIFDGCVGFPLDLAVAGGLVCQAVHRDDWAGIAVVVSNPIAKTASWLPTIGFGSNHEAVRVAVAMVVDHTARSFTVFLIESTDDVNGFQGTCLFIYDLVTDLWHEGEDPPQMTRAAGHFLDIESSIMFNERLYVLMGNDGQIWLWCYNYGDDTWVKPYVMHVSDVNHIKPDLVVCDNRLFLSSWVQQELPDGRSEWSYKIEAIDVEAGTCKTVFRMATAEIEELFQVPAKALKKFYEPDGGSAAARSPFHLAGFGFHKYIEVLTLGFHDPKVSIVFHPRTGVWEKRMTFPLHPFIPCPGEVSQELSFGTPMALLLPACTQWVEEEVEESNQVKNGDLIRVSFKNPERTV